MAKFFKEFKRWLAGDGDNEEIESLKIDNMDPPFSSLTSYLNVAAYDPVRQIFQLTAGAKNDPLGSGFVLELNPLLGANDDVFEQLKAVFEVLPEKVTGQIQMFGSPDLRAFFHGYENVQEQRSDNDPMKPVFRELAKKRTDFWKKGTRQVLFPETTVRLRHMRCILSINIPDTDFNDSNSLDEASLIQEQARTAFTALNMYKATWGPQDYIDWTSLLLNPYRMFLDLDNEVDHQWNDKMLIKEQLIQNRTVLKVLDDGTGIRFGTGNPEEVVISRCYSVSNYPESWGLAGMGALIGDALEPSKNYTSPWLISMNFRRMPYDETYNKTKLKSARATQVAESPMARILPDVHTNKRDYDLLMASFSGGKGGAMQIFHQLILWDKPESINLAERQADSIWRTRSFGMYRDQYLQLPAYLNMLPMALDKEVVRHTEAKKRWSTKTMQNAVSMAPVIGEWQGLGIPVIGLIGTRGQAMGINLFDNPAGNYNFAVIGGSGSGKSFTVNDMIRNYLGYGAQCWIIDVGRSYEKFCQMIGGQYIEFSFEDKICFPPFQMLTEAEEKNNDIEMIYLIFSLMASPGENLNEYQKAKLKTIIQAQWEGKGRASTVDDVIKRCLDSTLLNSDEPDYQITQLGEQMHAYSSVGVYGDFFNGTLNLEFTNDLVILELEELKTKPELQTIIMQLIIYKIMHSMYLSRDRYKIMMIDEAWALMGDSEGTAKFIEEGYRRIRKYKGAFGTATQGVDDYFKNPAATAALMNSDFVFHLRASAKSISAVQEKEPFSVDDSVMKRLRSLRKTDHYSEIFVHTPFGSGTGRLISDPFNALASSSKAEDMEAVNYYRTKGMNTAEALSAVLSDRNIKH